MKKLIAILLLTGITFGAAAQHGRYRQPVRNSHTVIRPHVSIGVGSYYGNRYSRPYYSSPYNSYSYNRTSQLDLRIRDIENEYRDRKSAIKNDNTLTRQQRKAAIRSLKFEKEREIIAARRNYFNR